MVATDKTRSVEDLAFIGLGILTIMLVIWCLVLPFTPHNYHTTGDSFYPTYSGMQLSFLFKNGSTLINETDCNSNFHKFGENCTCRVCTSWSGYDTDGFINRSGIYFSNGTLTGIPRQELDKFVELNRTKYQFEFIMQGHNGYTYNGEQWDKKAENSSDNESGENGDSEVSILNNSVYHNATVYNNTLAFNGVSLHSAVGGGGAGYVGSVSAACDLESKRWGDDCTCLSCGIWVGYKQRGFYNLTGVYYDGGTPTGMTMIQMGKMEEMTANYRYEMSMNEKGYYYDGNKWHGNGL
jgi:hypothetical protein